MIKTRAGVIIGAIVYCCSIRTHTQLSERYSNSSSLVNAAIMIGSYSTPHVALGLRTTSGWHCTCVDAAEAALRDDSDTADDKVRRVLQAVQEHTVKVGASRAVQRMALGVMLKGLVSVLCAMQSSQPCFASEALRALDSDGEWLHGMIPEASRGSQSAAIDPATQPVGAAVQKDKSLLQASGEVTYTGDLPAGVDALYGAFATSSVARGAVEAIDFSRVRFPHRACF